MPFEMRMAAAAGLAVLGCATAFPAHTTERSAFGGRVGATFNLTAYGAVGDNATDNTAAFKKAISAVESAGGGTLVSLLFPSVGWGWGGFERQF